MYVRHRYRRGAYPLAQESSVPRILKQIAALAIALLLLYWIGSWVLRLFGVGNPVERSPAVLYTEGRGVVTVSLQKAEAQPAENGMTLFPADSLSTGPGAHAAIHLFDGAWVRADQRSDVTLEESAHGAKQSTESLSLKNGALWMQTPPSAAFSGAIVRRVTTPQLQFDIPNGAEVAITPSSLVVFSADGQGVTVTAKNASPFAIGEGQQWALPASGKIGADPFADRTPLGPNVVTAFITESRQKYFHGAGSASGALAVSTDALTLTFPPDNYVLKEDTLVVKGTINDQVQQVLVNGHDAAVNQDKNTFSQEVSPPSGADLELHIQALDATKTVLADIRRTVKRQAAPGGALPGAPTITSPAKTGETYRTSAQELVLRGTSPAGAAGMMVNDYKLQLFNPDKGEWSYLASQTLGNMKPGTNIYDVTALDADGKRSPAARITIIVGEGGEGVAGSSASVAAASSKSSLNPATLPKNAPLLPGTLAVTAPTAGTPHAETGTGFVLEGTTSPKTETMWINDYQLKLYKPAKKTWNYIASAEFGNLKKGSNAYRITARDADGKILDQLDYTVDYEPGQGATLSGSSRSE